MNSNIMKLGVYLLFLFFLYGCSEAQLKTKLRNNSWTVEEVHYEDSTYGLFFFRMNMMNFSKDNSCELPYFEWAPNFHSEWEVSNVGSEYFDLTLINSDRNFLDGTYNSRIFYDESSNSTLLTLENERLKLVCKSAY